MVSIREKLHEKLTDELKVIDTFREFLDEIDVEHDGFFYDDSISLIFIKTRNVRETSNMIEEALGFGPFALMNSFVGVLTDKGEFKDHGSGWVYVRVNKI